MQLTKQEALDRLRDQIGYKTRVKDLAARFGVSPSFMSQVLSGTAEPSAKMLAGVGVERRRERVVTESFHEIPASGKHRRLAAVK